jgi:hypothetical protein
MADCGYSHWVRGNADFGELVCLFCSRESFIISAFLQIFIQCKVSLCLLNLFSLCFNCSPWRQQNTPMKGKFAAYCVNASLFRAAYVNQELD